MSSIVFPTIEQNIEDLFDRLPDAIVVTIFDKVQDAKSLCITSILCKRFQSLITQTQHISLTIPPNKSSSNKKPFIGFFNRVLLKPFQFLFRQISKYSPVRIPICKNSNYNCCTCTYASPAEILKSFNDIKQLQIRLPCPPGDNVGVNNSSESLLKWKAEFGSQLKNCLIVGGTSVSPIKKYLVSEETAENVNNNIHNVIPQMGREGEVNADLNPANANEELKLRIVWTISCLLAASSRHCLLEETIKEKQKLEDVVIIDDIGQGKCCMNREQVDELRKNATVISSTNRSKMPALKVKMWFVPELELPGEGCVVKGATLMVVKPVDDWKSKADDGGDLVAGGLGFAGDGKEEKVFDEVARELVKLKRSYSLEMNSF